MRRYVGPDRSADEREAATIEYLATGDYKRVSAAMKTLGGPKAFQPWGHRDLAAFWTVHRLAIRREAKRRGLEAYGEIYELYDQAGGRFVCPSRPANYVEEAAVCPRWDPADPRLLLMDLDTRDEVLRPRGRAKEA